MNRGFYLTLKMGSVIPRAVPKDVIESLTEVQVTSAASSQSGFQLKFTLGKNSAISRNYLPSGFFDPRTRVIIVATVNGAAHVLMDGVITKQDVTASNEPGQAALTITGMDLSVLMDFIDLTGFPYASLPFGARVALILAKYAVFGIIPIVVPTLLSFVKNPLESIAKHQGTDLNYINSLGQQCGYVFYIDPGPKPGISRAYWGPEIRFGASQPALSIDMDAATNVESLNFSYDGLSNKLLLVQIQEKRTKIPIPVPIPPLNPLKPPLAAKLATVMKSQVLRDTAKKDWAEAACNALSTLANAADAVSANGQLDVLRYGQVIKPRQLISVRGAGLTEDGLYFVKSVTHNIKIGEYKQSFSLVRGGVKSSISRVRV
ncbi:MAG: hypothetical protein ACE5HS_07870 [bacterium]